MAQITNDIMMIRPANFGYNEQTAVNNSFQTKADEQATVEISTKAIEEFDAMVEKLRSNGVNVHVIQDTASPVKPDCVFPNNWISFHSTGAVVTYPMYAPNRRIERREDIIESLGKTFDVKKRYSFEQYEKQDLFLEGTGSMIIDRDAKIVYACISKRTDVTILDKFCVLMGYERVVFTSVDRNSDPIYHTNVMMAIGETFAVICMESIPDEEEKRVVLESFSKTNKEVITITLDQVEQFAGNMLQVKGNEPYLVMSQSAYDSLNTIQIETIEKHTKILPTAIPTIETYGGGSVRCMLAEIFLCRL